MDQKCYLWVRSFSILELFKKLQTVFLFATVVTSGETFGNIGLYWGSRGPKTSQKGLLRGCCMGTQNWKFLTQQIPMMKLTTYHTDETYNDYVSS